MDVLLDYYFYTTPATDISVPIGTGGWDNFFRKIPKWSNSSFGHIIGNYY